MQIVQNFKKNRALWIGGAVLVSAVLLFIIMRGGGGGSTQVVTQGTSDTQAAINAELQSRQMEIQAGITIAGMQAAAQQAGAQAELAALNLTTGRQLEALNLQLASDRYGIDKNTELQLAGLASQEAILRLQENNALQREKLQADLSLAQSTLQADIYKTMALAQSEQAMAAINAQANMAMNQTAAFKDVNLAQIYAGVEMNNQNQATLRQQSSNALTGNIFGGLFGLVGGLFSDVRLKKNIKDEGYREKGFFGKHSGESLPEYSYEYTGGYANGRQYGIMAQDAFSAVAGAVYSRGDFLEVDYQRLS